MVIFCQNGAFMVLDVCGKNGGKKKSGSLDMRPLVTPKRLFRLFLANFLLDFANFLSEWGFGTWCACKVKSPVKIWFSRYGAIGDPLSTVTWKLFIRFYVQLSIDFCMSTFLVQIPVYVGPHVVSTCYLIIDSWYIFWTHQLCRLVIDWPLSVRPSVGSGFF